MVAHQITNQCTKFEVSGRNRNIKREELKVLTGHVTITMLLSIQGWFVIHKLGLVTVNLRTSLKFQHSLTTKIQKEYVKCRNWGDFEVRSPRGHQQHNHSIERTGHPI